jgi:protein-disulfide isomerase
LDKRFWGALIVVVLILGGVFLFAGGNKNNSGNTSSQPTSHVEGQGGDGITLVEYGDYECPFCGEYFPIVKQVEQTYNSQIFFQFRNLPLTEIHPNAFAGARAAEAAGLMGQFWQMHDLLYENQSAWVNTTNPETEFESFAQQLGLNVSTFEQDFASSTVNNLINADVSAFSKLGLQEATPTFILDGKQVQPQASVSSFEQIINAEIKKKGFTPPAGTSSTGSSTTSTGPTQSVQ